MRRLGLLALLSLFLLTAMPAWAAQEIKPFVRGSIQKIVSARQGKPFIINFWSLSCTYCGDELAMLKNLSAKYPKLDLVLISTDTRGEEKQVYDMLAKFSLNKAEAWVFAETYTERLYFEIDRKWQGELPRTYFFSAKNEIKSISGKLDQQYLEQWAKQQYGY